MQVRHDVYCKRTVAVVPPSREDVLNARDVLDTGKDAPLKLVLGLAKFNPKDKNFVKKIGRETAINNMQIVEGELTNCSSSSKGLNFTIRVDRVCLSFKLTQPHDVPHLIYSSYD